jgi:hypothetical protein
MTLDQLGGRRFLLTVISGAGTWLLTWAGKIDGGVYSAVTIATVAAYIVGNVAQRKVEAGTPGKTE